MKKNISVNLDEEIEDVEIAYNRLNDAEVRYLSEEELREKVT